MIFENIYIKLLRINHWFKNLFIFFGSFSAIAVTSLSVDINIILKLIVSFLIASSISSANYLVNQITDADFDAKHPKKKTRPIPSGKVSKEVAFILSIFIFLGVFFFSLKFFSFNFSLMIFIFWLAGIFYNVRPIRLKDIPYLDVLSESANNPIRFLIGWFALVPDLLPSFELLLISWSAGAFLMTAKRYDELLNFGKDLIPYRSTFKVYSLNKLKFFLITYLIISIVLFYFLILKINDAFLILFPLTLIYSYWLYRKIVSGKAKARNIESFVVTNDFLIFTFLIFSTYFIYWQLIK